MIVALIHWRIKPDEKSESAFRDHWKTRNSIAERSGLIGEFLSESLPMAASGSVGPAITPSQISGVFDLPDVATLNGISFQPDLLMESAFCNMQYQDRNGRLMGLKMPLEEVLKLFAHISQALRHPRILEHVLAVARREQAL